MNRLLRQTDVFSDMRHLRTALHAVWWVSNDGRKTRHRRKKSSKEQARVHPCESDDSEFECHDLHKDMNEPSVTSHTFTKSEWSFIISLMRLLGFSCEHSACRALAPFAWTKCCSSRRSPDEAMFRDDSFDREDVDQGICTFQNVESQAVWQIRRLLPNFFRMDPGPRIASRCCGVWQAALRCAVGSSVCFICWCVMFQREDFGSKCGYLCGPKCCRVLSDFLTHMQMSKSCTLIRFCDDTRCHTVQNDCFSWAYSQNQCKMCQVRALKEQTQEQQRTETRHPVDTSHRWTLKLREPGPYNTRCPFPLSLPQRTHAYRRISNGKCTQHKHKKRPNSFNYCDQKLCKEATTTRWSKKKKSSRLEAVLSNAKVVFDAIRRNKSAAFSMQDKRSAVEGLALRAAIGRTRTLLRFDTRALFSSAPWTWANHESHHDREDVWEKTSVQHLTRDKSSKLC